MPTAIWPSYAYIKVQLPGDAGIATQGMISYFLFWPIQLLQLPNLPTGLRNLFMFKLVAAPVTALATLVTVSLPQPCAALHLTACAGYITAAKRPSLFSTLCVTPYQYYGSQVLTALSWIVHKAGCGSAIFNPRGTIQAATCLALAVLHVFGHRILGDIGLQHQLNLGKSVNSQEIYGRLH